MNAQKLIITADKLNLRDRPSLQGEVLTVLARDTIVAWLESSKDQYWRKIQAGKLTGWASHKYLQAVTEEPRMESPYPWMAIAQRELGTHEVVGKGNNPRVVQYLRSTNLDAPSASSDETPWCSAFVNWCVERAGHAGTDSAWARSWLNWGRATKSPQRGSIVVFSRGVSSGHVAFFVSRSGDSVRVLGGNQSDAVTVASYPVSRVLGYRNPS